MDAFSVYKCYLAVKLHLTTERYDLFVYNSKLKADINAFNGRNDRMLFEKLSRKFSRPEDCIEYFVANIAYRNKDVMYLDDGFDFYDKWRQRKASISYIFSEQLSVLGGYAVRNKRKDLNSLYSIKDGIPPILSLHIGGHLFLETLVILDDIEHFTDTWKNIDFWKSEVRIVKKVKKFVKYNKSVVESKYSDFKENFLELHE